MSKPKHCTVCGAEIPTPRLEVAPQTLTCSRACSRELALRNRRKASKAWRDRQREGEAKGR